MLRSNQAEDMEEASEEGGVSHKTRQMIRYAAARSRCEICHNTQFAIRPETVAVGAQDYAVVTCVRCGRMGLHDMEVLRSKSDGAPIDTAPVEAADRPARHKPKQRR